MKLVPALSSAALLCLSIAGPAYGSDIVRFDVDAHCKKLAGFGGTYSEQMFEFCIDEEQSEYDALKANWGDVPSSVQDHCVKIARFGGLGSYQMLKFCVDEEMASRKSNASKQFKY